VVGPHQHSLTPPQPRRGAIICQPPCHVSAVDIRFTQEQPKLPHHFMERPLLACCLARKVDSSGCSRWWAMAWH
jgi:hypothetical protein